MKSNKLLLLAVATLVAILAASYMSSQRAPTTSMDKQLLLPGLSERVNDIRAIELTKNGKNLELIQLENEWVITAADNYPADFGKIKSTILGLAELKILSKKTSNPELYSRLGVEDPAIDGADSLLLTLRDTNQTELAQLIIGSTRHSKAAKDKTGLYVRLPEDSQALLVEGDLDLSADVTDWFTRELFNINSSRIQSIEISHPNAESVTLSREKDIDDFVLKKIPEGREAQSTVIISRMGTLLEQIAADNILKAEKLNGAEQIVATVQTFDGLIVKITSAKLDEGNYSNFQFSVAASNPDVGSSEETDSETASGDDPGAASSSLNAQLSAWAYAIPDFKFELFTRELDALTKAIQAEEEIQADKAQTSE
ncbi:MAG: DUF4340 domain-containing protein [Gammaproteobacteria bacterium]|nr:DUF4340 domain-containing protein [Gammaproteobacteria bacterium]